VRCRLGTRVDRLRIEVEYLCWVHYGAKSGQRRRVKGVLVFGDRSASREDALLGTCGLSKSSRLNVRAVLPVCNGLVRLINEGFRIPNRLRNVFGCGGGGGEFPPSEDATPFVFTVGTRSSPRTLDIRPDAFTVTAINCDVNVRVRTRLSCFFVVYGVYGLDRQASAYVRLLRPTPSRPEKQPSVSDVC